MKEGVPIIDKYFEKYDRIYNPAANALAIAEKKEKEKKRVELAKLWGDDKAAKPPRGRR